MTSPMRVFHNGFPRSYVVRDQASCAVAGEKQSTRRRQQTSTTPTVAVIGMSPGDLSRLIVDCRQIGSARSDSASSLPPSPIDPRGSRSVK